MSTAPPPPSDGGGVNQQLSDLVSKLTVQLERLAHTNRALFEENHALVAQNDDLQRRNASLESSMRVLEEEGTAYKNSFSLLTMELQEKNKEVEKLKQTSSEAQGNSDHHRKAFEEIKAKSVWLNNRLQDLTRRGALTKSGERRAIREQEERERERERAGMHMDGQGRGGSSRGRGPPGSRGQGGVDQTSPETGWGRVGDGMDGGDDSYGSSGTDNDDDDDDRGVSSRDASLDASRGNREEEEEEEGDAFARADGSVGSSPASPVVHPTRVQYGGESHSFNELLSEAMGGSAEGAAAVPPPLKGKGVPTAFRQAAGGGGSVGGGGVGCRTWRR